MTRDLEQMLKRSVEIVNRMTPEERDEMCRLQRESWVRAEARCEHGNEWDACDDCRQEVIAALERKPE